mgnify:CR=1 FL=1
MKKKEFTLDELAVFQKQLVPCVCGGNGSMAMGIWKPTSYTIHCRAGGPECWRSPVMGTPEDAVQVWNDFMNAAHAAGVTFTPWIRPKTSGDSLY